MNLYDNENADRTDERIDDKNSVASDGTAEQEQMREPSAADNGTPSSQPSSHTFGVSYGPTSSPTTGQPGGYSYIPYTAPAGATPRKKKKSGAGRVLLLVAAIILCVVVAASAGFGGSYLARKLFPETAAGGSDNTTENTPGALVLSVSDGSKITPVSTVSVAQGERMSIADTVVKVKDSVVEITTETIVNGSRYSQYVQSGAGSGVIISIDGYIITNNHVINDATEISVRLTDGTSYKAKLVGTDDTSDIAIIKITPDRELTVAVFGDSSKLVVGEEIIVIGNPLGELGGTVTNGIISALEREVAVSDNGTMTLLQTNAAVNPGNSGGGMFNLYGELVGVVNAKSSGTEIEGLGFAIPINGTLSIIDQLVEYGYVRGKPSLGLTIYDATDTMTAMYYFRSYNTGAYIIDAEEKSGFEYGDRVISIDGTEITSSADINDIVKKHSVGDILTFNVARNGKTVEVKVTLTEYVPANIDSNKD